MIYNGEWSSPKVVMYCQIGQSVDMAKFSIKYAIERSGLPDEDVDIVFICWKTSTEAYDWLKQNNFKFINMDIDPENDNFLYNLYGGWNLGYEIGFLYADFVCPIATDHCFYDNWLKNLLKHGKENRIVNCKLIESGVTESLHTIGRFGATIEGEFELDKFNALGKAIVNHYGDRLVMSKHEYERGVRLDAMPFLCPRDVWERFGPMNRGLDEFNITGDTNFFNRCEAGGVEITKALDAISYHFGGGEQRMEKKDI